MKNVLITGATGFIGSKLKGKKFDGRLENKDNIFAQSVGVEGIIHLAAKSNKRRCEENLKACIETNLVGLCNVLEVALERNIWVLFISTYQVKDSNLYGLTKLTGEELCRLYQQKGLRVRIIRLPTVYGPGDKPDKIVTKFINVLRLGDNPKIETDKKLYFGYVDDIIKLIENEVKVFKWEKGKKYSLTDLEDGIRRCLNDK